MRIFISILLAFSLLTGNSGASDGDPRVSIIALIANPEKYDGKLVSVTGFAYLEFEGNILYYSKAAFDYGVGKDGLWLNIDKQTEQKKNAINGHYVQIDATFDATDRGHRNYCSGALKDITRLEVMPTRTQLKQQALDEQSRKQQSR